MSCGTVPCMAGDIPTIRFAVAPDGARIGYQDFGLDGPIVVAVPPMAQNIEAAWQHPLVREMFERFGSFSRWIHFDKRGTGVSDRRSHMPGIDERVEDLRAVMDAAEVDRAHVFGQSEGGPMALLFAATYPERVESLTLFGSGARSLPYLDGEALVQRKEMNDWFVTVVGTEESPMVDLFAPSLAGDASFREWHQRYERLSADSESLRELLDISLDIDVSDILADLDVPVLILHRTGDLVVPVELGRETAAAISGAKFVELEGDDHFGFAGNIASWVDEVERFVTGTVRDREPVPDRPSIEIRTLGRFEILEDGDPVPTSEWGSRLARQLCKRLVAGRGHPVPREELIELLWPGEPDLRRLGARLSVQLSTVRRVLRGGVLATRSTVALDLAEVTSDLEAVLTTTDDEVILNSYNGEFLPEDRAEDWSAGARDEARAAFVGAARRRGELLLTAGDHHDAAKVARRLVAEDRFDDRSHRLLVEILLQADELGEARRAHQAWAAAMHELGIDVPDFEVSS